MACPKCGMAMALRERICPRCKYFADGDRFVSVSPPRLSRPGRPGGREGPQVISTAARVRLQAPRCRFPRLRAAMAHAAAIVPGLSHVLHGRWIRGLVFLVLVGGTLGASVYLFKGISGQALFGVAASIHAYSIFDLTSYRYHPGLFARTFVMALILAGLVSLIYGPVLFLLAEHLVPRREVGPIGLMAFILTVYVFLQSVFRAVAAWVWALHAGTSSGPGRDY